MVDAPTGSCICGGIKISFTGDPVFTLKEPSSRNARQSASATDDRKMPDTQVWQIPQANFSIDAGELKTYSKVSDHGHEIRTHFCPHRGTAMYRTGGAMQVQGLIGLRAGVLDDQSLLNERPPKIEVYVDRRPKWIGRVPEATQLSSEHEILERRAADQLLVTTGGVPTLIWHTAGFPRG
ncbi:hypothetical protein LTR53_009544 [Teratosphaeriaceae sp. CCFEE 6253]|nr:hypothetical protein LTR53_009544 [Teratosphaeriaceae sp. CCFEE 6253]